MKDRIFVILMPIGVTLFWVAAVAIPYVLSN